MIHQLQPKLHTTFIECAHSVASSSSAKAELRSSRQKQCQLSSPAVTTILIAMTWFHTRMSLGTSLRTEMLATNPDGSRFFNAVLAKRAVAQKQSFSHRETLGSNSFGL